MREQEKALYAYVKQEIRMYVCVHESNARKQLVRVLH
jgi:hypothetical protein